MITNGRPVYRRTAIIFGAHGWEHLMQGDMAAVRRDLLRRIGKRCSTYERS
jgi:hypothetical protein